MAYLNVTSRRDPTAGARAGEAALLVLTAAVAAIALAAVAGVGLAAAVAGRGWIWPHGNASAAQLVRGLVTGHPDRGLTAHQVARLPSAAATYAGVAVCELALLTLVAAAAVVLTRRVTTAGDPRRGLASPRQARAALGTRSLRRHTRIIRPDLHPRRPPRDSRARAQTTPRGA